MAISAIPEVRDEGSGGNAWASRARIRPKHRHSRQRFKKNCWIGKERNTRIVCWCAPDSIFESGFCFFGRSKT